MARRQVWILGGGTLVAGAAVMIWLALSSREVPVVGPASLIPQEAAPQAAPQPAPLAANTPEAPQTQPMPTFDLVRISAEGDAVVAGQAVPGAAVTLRVDGAPVAQAAADGAGQFVALFALGYSDTMQMMTLEAADAQGRVVQSPDTVMLTPRPAPVAGAAAPEAGPDPVDMAQASAPSAQDAPATAEATPPDVGPAARVEVAAVLPEAAAATPEPLATSEGASAVPAAEGSVDESAPVAVAEAAPAEAPAETTISATPDAVAVETVAQAAPEPARAAAPEPSTALATRLAAAPEDSAPTPEPAGAIPATPADASQTAAADPAPQAAPDPAPETLAAAPQAPTAILMRGDGRVQVLDRAPQVMDNVVIDAISYSDTGDVQISGRAASGDPAGTLRIYLDNRPVALARAEGGDWTLDLPAVDAGIYTLRVDQLNPEGGVVSRFETPFLRESPDALAQARARLDGGQAPASASDATAAPSAPEENATAAATLPPEPAPEPVPRAALITVQPGNTLWAISRDRYGEGARYMVIFNANRSQIRDPDLIYPGQVFALPDE